MDLKKTLFLLPNMITLSSVFCGFYSMVLASRAVTAADFQRAALLIVFAMFFDMLDGRVARMTKTQSAFGLQIDSLADVVSFGAAPALLMYYWSLHRLGLLGLLGGFAFVACGAIRLARFNVLSMDDSGAPQKPGKYIMGLPIPGGAAVLVSLVVANEATGGTIGDRHASLLLVTTFVVAGLMVSSLKFRSFKDLALNGRSIALVAFALGTSGLIAMRWTPAFVLAWLLGFYVGLALCEWLVAVPRRSRDYVRSLFQDEDGSAVPHEE
ncbi:MAG: CDP-diacylglycerol--serine O-phosphatidyltransferase [Myxococcales bacterium]|nr:CDP-diacylglycerol--serine O-phosphatidyltransferase [Myxococcales bacterium]